ncbi:MAG: hypothetical protein ACE5G0_11305 [Rhodothermales bacterium]
MKKLLPLYAVAILFLIPGLFSSNSNAQPIPFDSDRWEVSARESRTEDYLGRQSLYLKGGVAWIKDDDFTNGIIEFDVAFTGERGFMGGIWRMQDRGNYEEFYIRPHQSGNPDANQYTPVFNGLAGWQLYYGEGYGAPVTYPFDQWIHVKIVIADNRGEVYIDSDEPVLVIQELKHEIKPGKVGVSAGNFAPAHFSNFSYQKVDSPTLKSTPKEVEPTPEGMVTAWLVSDPFDEAMLADKYLLTDEDEQARTWTTLDTEPTGLTNLARIPGIAQGTNTTFARITLHSEREQVKKIRFGFSDRVKVYLNGRLLYGGTNLYRSRDYRYLGTLGLFDELYLPLNQGANKLWFAVSESFGGWGLQCLIEDPTGLRIEK